MFFAIRLNLVKTRRVIWRSVRSSFSSICIQRLSDWTIQRAVTSRRAPARAYQSSYCCSQSGLLSKMQSRCMREVVLCSLRRTWRILTTTRANSHRMTVSRWLLQSLTTKEIIIMTTQRAENFMSTLRSKSGSNSGMSLILGVKRMYKLTSINAVMRN